MSDELKEFQTYRQEMNEKILNSGNLDIKRFFALDSAVYRDGALDPKTKEMMGLVASAVLRCNDCILYHIDQCIKFGVTAAEFHELMSIVLVVGGSITIPHVRYGYDMFEKVSLAQMSD